MSRFFAILLAGCLLAGTSTLADAPNTAPRPIEKPTPQSDLRWLTLALYHEARGESDEGVLAVATALLNRVAHPAFPPTVMAVVTQGGEALHECQLSFWCDGRSDAMEHVPDRTRVKRLAKLALGRHNTSSGLHFGCAVHSYHVSGHPMSEATVSYFEKLQRAALIGEHVFYCDSQEDAPTS